MSQAIAEKTTPYAFDDSNIKWYPLGDIEHMSFSLLDVDLESEVINFIVKFDAGERIIQHRHTSHANTFVIAGEHRMYHPDGSLKEVRPAGSYTSSPPGDSHYEGSGDEQAIVLYNILGHVDGKLFELMDDEKNIVAVLGMEDVKGAWAEQKGTTLEG
jgi:quercetin dioxygenase-like cupin family protein